VSRTKSRSTYHHGDARSALVAAASELLETAGAAGLSLRQLSANAGLSRQAPYNHFADKQALLAELVRIGFECLSRELEQATTTLAGVSALAIAAEVYIGFAQRSPALFRLMFSRELVDRSRFPIAKVAAEAAFHELTKVIATIVPDDQVEDSTLAAWSIVHGYATLCNETEIEPASQRKLRAAQFAQLVAASPRFPLKLPGTRRIIHK
jgi:AcrR family transcriptional regulator